MQWAICKAAHRQAAGAHDGAAHREALNGLVGRDQETAYHHSETARANAAISKRPEFTASMLDILTYLFTCHMSIR